MIRLSRWAGLALALLLIAPAQATDFAPVLEGRRLVFPEDSGAHPDYQRRHHRI